MKAIKRFEKLDFFKTLLPILQNYMSQQEYDKNFTRHTRYERYNIDVLLSANSIIDCLDQINYSIEMLSGFKRKRDSVMNRHDYIVFILENFYLRITSIFDRILRFSNVALEIGLLEKECKESTIIKNDKIKGTNLYSVLIKLNTFIDKYRYSRNKIAHSESFSEKGLIDIQVYYIFLDSENHQDIEQYKTFFKLETDEYVVNKKKELMEITNDLEELLIDFFNEITPFVDTIGQRYKNAK
jgi:hypothetical protein